jgi:hypothetical protein
MKLIFTVAVVGAFSLACIMPRNMSQVKSEENHPNNVRRELILRPFPTTLPIPSRRQWDCNYHNKPCCLSSGWDFYASCLYSTSYLNSDPQHDLDESLTIEDCRYGENQCALVDGLSQPNASCVTKPDCSGYCGSASIQESLLYYGAYVSQGTIRRAITFNDKMTAKEILIASHIPNQKPDLLETAKVLGLNGKMWYANQSGVKGAEVFYNWAKSEIETYRNPVIAGLITNESANDSYDHIVTVIDAQNQAIKINDHFAKASMDVHVSFKKY